MLAALSRLVGGSRKKKARIRRTFKPRIDVLERRALLATLFVDDDLVQTPDAEFQTIQAAVDVAAPGDIIRVAPGTYEESVVVDVQVTLIGAGASPDDATDPLLASIVDVPEGSTLGFNVLASGVAIQGFTIGDLDGSSTDTVGIQTSREGSGYRISGNVIQENTFGIYLHSDGTQPTLVLNNTIRNNNAELAASGNGIYSDQGLSNAQILGNRISGHENAAIILVDSGVESQFKSNITIAGNTLEDSGIILTNTTDSTIIGNTIANSAGSGIFLGGGNADLTIAANRLTDGAFTAINLRTNAFENAPEANTDIQILANVITNWGDSGIRLREGTNNVSVRGNIISGSDGDGLADPGFGNGISIEGSFENQVLGNTLIGNNNSGIFADSDSTDNVMGLNFALFNGEWDFLDESSGAGTAGTANAWQGNFGLRSNPSGLRGGLFGSGGLFGGGGLLGNLLSGLGGLFGL